MAGSRKRKRDSDTGYHYPALPEAVTPAPGPAPAAAPKAGPAGAVRVKVQGDSTLEDRELLNALTRILGRTAGELLSDGLHLVRDGLDTKTRRQVDQVQAALLTAARGSIAAAASAPKRPRRNPGNRGK